MDQAHRFTTDYTFECASGEGVIRGWPRVDGEVGINWCIWLSVCFLGAVWGVFDRWLEGLGLFFWRLDIGHLFRRWHSACVKLVRAFGMVGFRGDSFKHPFLQLNHPLSVIVFLIAETTLNTVFQGTTYCSHYLYSYYI